MSWPGPRGRWCTGILKTRIVAAYLKKLKEEYTVIEYVGIAADETKRIKDKKLPACRMGNDGTRLSFLLLQAGF